MSTMNTWGLIFTIAATSGCSGSDSSNARGDGNSTPASCSPNSKSTSLASGETGEFISPAQIAVTASGASWIDGDGSVWTVPIAGGTPAKLFSSEGSSGKVERAQAITADPASVYVLGLDGSVYKVPATGGEPQLLGTGKTGVYSRIAVAPPAIFWSSDKTIEKLSLAGGTATAVVADSNGDISTLAVDEDGVFWLSTDSTKVHLHHAGSDGANSEELGAWDGMSGALALDADSAYVAVTRPLQTGSLYRVPKSGGSATELASNQPESVVLSSDGTNVYYGVHLSGADSRVRRVAVSGGKPTDFVCGSGHIFGLIANGPSVFWTLGHEGGGWSVYSTAK